MKTHFTNGFFDSLKKINKYNTGLYKTYDFFKYKIPKFFKNIWYFRKELSNFEHWDYRYNLELFNKSLKLLANYLEHHGIEIDETRLKKVQKIKRAITILDNICEDKYIDIAEESLGKMILHDWEFEKLDNGNFSLIDKDTPEEKEHNKSVINLSRKLEKDEWNELFEILKGQGELVSHEDFDGSNIKSWWD